MFDVRLAPINKATLHHQINKEISEW